MVFPFSKTLIIMSSPKNEVNSNSFSNKRSYFSAGWVVWHCSCGRRGEADEAKGTGNREAPSCWPQASDNPWPISRTGWHAGGCGPGRGHTPALQAQLSQQSMQRCYRSWAPRDKQTLVQMYHLLLTHWFVFTNKMQRREGQLFFSKYIFF